VANRVPIQAPDSSRQVRFHESLAIARSTWLVDALRDAQGRVDPNQLKHELSNYVPVDVQQLLGAAGIRDEDVFPTPVLLEIQPTLVGYYRLLLGVPQKTFYGSGAGRGRFRIMEVRGTIDDSQRALLPEFCAAMSTALADLVRRMNPRITPRDVAELPLLTLGSQFQGGNNNTIGKAATKGVFLAIADAIKDWIVDQSPTELNVRTPDMKDFVIALANDPDVRFQRKSGGELVNLLSIEIKGGTDRSNVYNRGGEAEKSHQGAKTSGYRTCWTVIGMTNIDVDKLTRGSPTTDAWFDTVQIVARSGRDWERFQEGIRSSMLFSEE
jgi:hypothetical protein